MGATCAAGDEALRSRNTQRTPKGYPANASMRPNCPAPTMPTRDSFKSRADPLGEHGGGLCPAKGVQSRADVGPIHWEDRGPRTARHSSLRQRRWQRWRRGCRSASGQSTAANRCRSRPWIVRVLPVREPTFWRRSYRPGGGAAGPRDDGLQTALARPAAYSNRRSGVRLGRHHANLMRDTERIEDLGGALHRLPVGRRSIMIPTRACMPVVYQRPTRATGVERKKLPGANEGERCSQAAFSFAFPAT